MSWETFPKTKILPAKNGPNTSVLLRFSVQCQNHPNIQWTKQIFWPTDKKFERMIHWSVACVSAVPSTQCLLSYSRINLPRNVGSQNYSIHPPSPPYSCRELNAWGVGFDYLKHALPNVHGQYVFLNIFSLPCRWQFHLLRSGNRTISRELISRNEPAGTLSPAPDGLPAPRLQLPLPHPHHHPPHAHHLRPPRLPRVSSHRDHPPRSFNPHLGVEPEAAGQPSHHEFEPREAAVDIDDNVVAAPAAKVIFFWTFSPIVRTWSFKMIAIESLSAITIGWISDWDRAL